jgi:hypothetical protein
MKNVPVNGNPEPPLDLPLAKGGDKEGVKDSGYRLHLPVRIAIAVHDRDHATGRQ